MSSTILLQIFSLVLSKMYCRCHGWYIIKVDGTINEFEHMKLTLTWTNPTNLASRHTIKQTRPKQVLILNCFQSLSCPENLNDPSVLEVLVFRILILEILVLDVFWGEYKTALRMAPAQYFQGSSLQFWQYVHLKKEKELKMNYLFHLGFKLLGPVPQSPIKLTLNEWKILIAILYRERRVSTKLWPKKVINYKLLFLKLVKNPSLTVNK